MAICAGRFFATMDEAKAYSEYLKAKKRVEEYTSKIELDVSLNSEGKVSELIAVLQQLEPETTYKLGNDYESGELNFYEPADVPAHVKDLKTIADYESVLNEAQERETLRKLKEKYELR